MTVNTTPSYTEWKIGRSTFQANPSKGARLMKWEIENKDGSSQPLIYWPEDAYGLDNIAKVRGGNPVLFPFSARCFYKGEAGYWKMPNGDKSPYPNHGFTRQGTFSVVESSDSGFSAKFQPDEAAQSAFPYDYDFIVSYTFSADGLTVAFTLENKGAVAISWSAGHHFYFALPAEKRSSSFIELPAKKAWYQAPDGSMQADSELIGKTDFSNAKLPERHHTHFDKPEVTFDLAGTPLSITSTLSDATNTEWLTVVTWTENEDSPFYCVEPWMGLPNAPEHNMGLYTVAPGQSQTYTVEIALV